MDKANVKLQIRWQTIDPLGNTVALKEETYLNHITNDHEPKDAAFRNKTENLAFDTIIHPRYIIKDFNNDNRVNYIDIVQTKDESGRVKLKVMKVVVDIIPNPNEVVTFIVQRKISDTVKEEGVIYDSQNQ